MMLKQTVPYQPRTPPHVTEEKSRQPIPTHSQSRLDSFQTVKTFYDITHFEYLNFISFLGCFLSLEGDRPQTTIPREKPISLEVCIAHGID